MKKIVLFALCVLTLGACKNENKTLNPDQIRNDSLRSVIEARDNEINDMMGTLNEIQAGFDEINAAEERLAVVKNDESGDKSTRIKENIQFIAQRMKENRELIKRLQEQLRETGFKGDQMRKTLENLTAQLQKKDSELKALRTELENKNIHIAELDQTINNLNDNVKELNTEKEKLTTEKENLQTESNQKTETINSQDKQLNTAWYVFGTKKELKAQNILSSGEVLKGGFNKNYFSKIDIRVTKEIKLYSKSVKILTSHPSTSYRLDKDSNSQYVLRITDPQNFWSTSKYLVVQVK